MPFEEEEQVDHRPQRRKRAVTPRRQQLDARSDEFPEVPKVRRASLFIDQQTTLPAVPPLEENEELERPQPKPRSRPISRPHHPYHYSNQPVSQKPPRAHSKRHIHSRFSLYEQVLRARHNQPVVIIVSIIIIALILLPLIVAVTHSQSQAMLAGSADNTPVSVGAQPPGAHELVIVPSDTDHPAPPVYATSAYLLDADTGTILYARNPFMHLSMLSTTKLMTAVLAAEYGNPDQKITINNQINNDVNQLSADSARFNFKKGETYTLREMLYALILVSGNDAAIAIADTVGGNLPGFVAKMNQRAQQLGLYDTHYMNSHGLLQDGQYSSAHDLATLGKYALSIPLLHQISGKKIYDIPQGGNHPERIIINGNQFLWWYPGVDGGKTGYAPDDYIQVISAVRNHHHLIGVVMHTNNWWTDMRDLMNWGFNTFAWVSPHDADITNPPIPYDNLWNYFVDDKKENTIPTVNGGRYYIYTGFSVADPILSYYDANGGLKKFGYPTAMESIGSGSVVSQHFEQGTIQCDLTANSCRMG